MEEAARAQRRVGAYICTVGRLARLPRRGPGGAESGVLLTVCLVGFKIDGERKSSHR